MFYEHILNRWNQLDQPVILTLDYFFDPLYELGDDDDDVELDKLNQQDPWFLTMIEDYKEFFKYVRKGNRKKAKKLLNKKGLNVNSGFMVENEKVTALELVERKREKDPEKYEEMYEWLRKMAGLEQD